MKSWTEEQEAALRKYWFEHCSLKSYLHLFGDRTYMAVVAHAKRSMKLGVRPNSVRGMPPYAWDCIKDELARGGPGTAPELVKRTGLTTAPVCKRLSEANAGPAGEIHIYAWLRRRTGGEPVAVYAIGPGENAVKPEPLTISEKNRLARSRKRVKANPFLVAIHQVTGDPVKNQHIQRGRYTSRVIQQEAA